MHPNAFDRRRFGVLAAAALFAPGTFAQAARMPIADMHSHINMFARRPAFDLRRQLADTGTQLLAWTIVDDSRWIRRTAGGISQVAHPAPGEIWSTFQRYVREYDAALASPRSSRSWTTPPSRRGRSRRRSRRPTSTPRSPASRGS